MQLIKNRAWFPLLLKSTKQVGKFETPEQLVVEASQFSFR